MKRYFLYGLLFVIPLWLSVWFLYALGRSLATVYQDWRLQREMGQLRVESEARREKRRLENEKRLANGCRHDFAGSMLGMPPGVCSRCGLQKEKPAGPCDHVWRLGKGAVSNIYCDKCGKTDGISADHSDYA